MDSNNFHPTTDRQSGGLPASPHPMVHTSHLQEHNKNSQSHEDVEYSSVPTAIKSISKVPSSSHEVSAFNAFPDELWNHILKYLLYDPAKLLPFDQRASLSFESFASAPPHVSEDAGNLLKFRLLCKKTYHLGRSRVFSRVRIRFSRAGFQRILSIINDPEIASEVRKVSYMVHDLYPQDEERLEQILRDVQSSILLCEQRLDGMHISQTALSTQLPPAVRRLKGELERCKRNEAVVIGAIERAAEQRQIIQEKEDERVLVAALTAFKNVEQIRLMRNVDKFDARWDNFLSANHNLRQELGPLRWTTACERATIVLGRAYLASESVAHRLSSRFMDPRPEWLQENISQAAISSLSTRLLCLELQIDDPSNLDDKMSKLSDFFHTVFNAAGKMKGLHIGLRRQISIPLENIFHNVTWPRLFYIGFSRWNMSCDEIIHFIYRHRASLKSGGSVRFREVRLTKGRWIEVLKFLRQQLRLKWASFRQVGYEPRLGGGLVPECGFGGGFARLRNLDDENEESESSGDSDSEIGHHAGAGDGGTNHPEHDDTDRSDEEQSEGPADDDNENEETVPGLQAATPETANGRAGPPHINQPAESLAEEDQSDNTEESPSGSVAGDSEVGVVNGLAIDDQIMIEHSSAPPDPSPDGPLPDCDCWNGFAWGDLEDDHGLDPTKPQWKKWEKWVVKGCSRHDPPAS